jgi:hypothetical protein
MSVGLTAATASGPSFDSIHEMIYVGSSEGVVYSVEVPLP